MRILIYSETEEAKALLATLRGEGHHASLRNPQYFNPAQFDKSPDKVFVMAGDAEIFDAYHITGIPTEWIVPPDMKVYAYGDQGAFSDEAPSLESLTVAQLKKLAEERGIDLTGKTKKDDIIAAIEAVDGAKPE